VNDAVKVAVPFGTVYLAPKLTVPMGAAAMAVLNGVNPTIPAMQAALISIYLSPAPAGGIVGWEGSRFSVKVDGIEQPAQVTQEAIDRLLPWTEGGAEVAEKADALYSGDLFRPLAQRRSTASEPTPTAVSTPPIRDSGSTPPKSSKRSSPNGSAGNLSAVPAP
jgi:hypothetical protein